MGHAERTDGSEACGQQVVRRKMVHTTRRDPVPSTNSYYPRTNATSSEIPPRERKRISAAVSCRSVDFFVTVRWDNVRLDV